MMIKVGDYYYPFDDNDASLLKLLIQAFKEVRCISFERFAEEMLEDFTPFDQAEDKPPYSKLPAKRWANIYLDGPDPEPVLVDVYSPIDPNTDKALGCIMYEANNCMWSEKTYETRVELVAADLENRRSFSDSLAELIASKQLVKEEVDARIKRLSELIDPPTTERP